MKVRLALLLALVAIGPADAAFPGTNGRIAYTKVVSERSEHCCHVVTIRPDGKDPRDLGEGRDPAWSPDGTMLAFASDESGGIWVMDAEGGFRRQVSRTGYTPAWAPDGRRLVVAAAPGGLGNLDLYIVDVATGESTRLTNGVGPDSTPAWSPDGGLIAYTYESDLWTITPDGTRARMLRRSATHPSWSPDGQSIAFSTTDGFITVIGREGGGERRLRRGESPAWSPDGRRIVFRGTHGLCIADADGRNARGIAYDRSHDPDWQPAGTGAVSPSLGCDAPAADVSVSVTARPATVSVGEPVTYAVVVTNRGPDPAPRASFKLRLPDGGELVGKRGRQTVIGPCSFVQGYFQRTASYCDAKEALDPGRRIEVRFKLIAEEPGRLRVTAVLDNAVLQARAAALVRGCTILGTPGRDVLIGTQGRDVICGDEGSDTIRGLGSADVLYGGEGADRIEGGVGNDVLSGDFGNDRLLGDAGADRIFMGHGDDDVFAGAGADLVDATQSWNRRQLLDDVGEQDRDRIHGGSGADTLEGGPKRDFYYGESGSDLLLTRDGTTDHAVCGPGRDRMYSDAEDTSNRDCEFVQPQA